MHISIALFKFCDLFVFVFLRILYFIFDAFKNDWAISNVLSLDPESEIIISRSIDSKFTWSLMEFKRKGKCVFKITKKGKKKKGCSKTVAKAKKYVKALYANSDDVMSEIKDYFRDQNDKEYLEFDESEFTE